MTILTDHARNLLARALAGRSPALPTQVFAALGTGGNAAQGLTGEPTAGGYARQRVTFSGTGAQANAEAVRFVLSAAIGTITHIGLFDAASGGNPLAVAALPQPAVMSGPGTVTIAAEALTLSVG
ncbi:MAG: hypothetical protein N2Z67_02805 [Acetobacteraceae bacterium]|nr:hypothetical protein [Acetobacteraceae bacterium]